MTASKIHLIVAMDEQQGIGKGNDLPWRLKADLNYFRKITCDAVPGKQNMVLMGRNTWDSIPDAFRPLPNRHNVVLTSRYREEIAVPQLHSWEAFTDYLNTDEIQTTIDKVFIIGGASIYDQALNSDLFDIQKLYITQVSTTVDCDVFFPKIPDRWSLESESDWQTESQLRYQFQVWS